MQLKDAAKPFMSSNLTKMSGSIKTAANSESIFPVNETDKLKNQNQAKNPKSNSKLGEFYLKNLK